MQNVPSPNNCPVLVSHACEVVLEDHEPLRMWQLTIRHLIKALSAWVFERCSEWYFGLRVCCECNGNRSWSTHTLTCWVYGFDIEFTVIPITRDSCLLS